MGKRSNGTRGTNSSNSAKSRKTDVKLDFSNPYNPKNIIGMQIGLRNDVMEEYAMKLGATKEGYKKAMYLLNQHGGNESEQAGADPILLKEINSNTELGKALRAIAKVNELHYKDWGEYDKAKRKQDIEEIIKTSKDPFYFSDPKRGEEYARDKIESLDIKYGKAGNPKIYRAGKSKDVEAWTTNTDGVVNMGNIVLQTNMKSTIKDKIKDSYMFGFSHIVGQSGEFELLFIKKLKRNSICQNRKQ